MFLLWVLCITDACFLWIWCSVCVFVFLVWWVLIYARINNIYSMPGSCMFSYVYALVFLYVLLWSFVLICSYVLMFNTHILYLSINYRSSSLDLRSSTFAFGLKHYLCLVWCVGSGWALQGPRHGRFQLLRLGLHCLGVSGGARGCGAIAMAGGSAFARLCAIANLCGQRSTTGEQRRVAEEIVSCRYEMVPMETTLGSDALMFRCSTPISYIYDLTLWCSLTILVHALKKYGCVMPKDKLFCVRLLL